MTSWEGSDPLPFLRLMSVITGPIPHYQNVPINAQFYEPGRFVIAGITRGIETIVETTLDHNFVIGQEVRLVIPYNFGSYQLNQRKGFVLSIPTTNTVVTTINSVDADPFSVPSSLFEQAQIVAIGNVNTGAQNNQGRINNTTYVPGSFINISPA
jgi:hypothetical protein